MITITGEVLPLEAEGARKPEGRGKTERSETSGLQEAENEANPLRVGVDP